LSESEDDPAPPPRGQDAPEVADPEVLPAVPAAEDESVAYQQRARLAEDRLAEVLNAYREFRQETEAYRERLTRQFQRKYEQRHEALLLKFIDVLDNFDRALEASQTAGDSLVEGLILVRTQLLTMLQDEGLERIPVVGLPFDPHVSEAVTTVPVDDPDQHHVVMQEMLRGYRIKGKIARASRVAIGEYTAEPVVEAPPPPARAQEPLIGESAAPRAAGNKATPPGDLAAAAAAAAEVVVEPETVVEAETIVETEAVVEVEAAVEPEVAVVSEEVLEIEAEPLVQVQEADGGLSLDEIIARAEAREAEAQPAPASQAIRYDDLTELAEVDEEVVRAEEGGAEDDDK
jgi:molecular chaperone GrpE